MTSVPSSGLAPPGHVLVGGETRQEFGLLPLWEKVDRRVSAETDEGCWPECSMTERAVRSMRCTKSRSASFFPTPLIRPRLRLGHLLPQGEKGMGRAAGASCHAA